MGKALKTVLLFAGAYATALITGWMAAMVTFMVMPTHGCSGMGRALAALKIVIAVAFCVSLAIATLVGMRLGLPLAVKICVPCILAALLLATYVAVAFGLTVAFNC